MKTKLWIIVGILIIALAAMVAPVMAGTSDIATITANPSKVISVTINGAGISNWALDPTNSPKVDSTTETLTVSSNSPGWLVKVKDALDNDGVPAAKPSAGYMVDYLTTGGGTWGTTKLNSKLQVGSASVEGLTGSTVTLSGVDQTIEQGAGDATGAGTFTTTALTFTQQVAYTDPVLGANHVYRIIVTFTGTTP